MELPSHSDVVERQVVVGSRAGGLLNGNAAAGWLVLETMVIRTEVAAPGVAKPFHAARLEISRHSSRHRRGPLRAVAAPLVAGKRVVVGAAAAFSAWPPALRERWHTCRRCWRVS